MIRWTGFTRESAMKEPIFAFFMISDPIAHPIALPPAAFTFRWSLSRLSLGSTLFAARTGRRGHLIVLHRGFRDGIFRGLEIAIIDMETNRYI